MSSKKRPSHRRYSDTTLPGQHLVTVDTARLDREIERASMERAQAESQASIARISARFAPKKV